MKLGLACLLVFFIVGMVFSQELPLISSQIPSNYSYPLLASSIFEGSNLPSIMSTSDSFGNIFSCFTTGTPFKFGNMTYTPSDTVTFLVKMLPNLRVAWIKEYPDYSSYSCRKIALDKQEQNIYFEVEATQVVKVNIQSTNVSMSWDNIGSIIWDIVDEDKLLIAQRISQGSASSHFAQVCPTDRTSYYIGVAIISRDAVLSYQCFFAENSASEISFVFHHGTKVYLFGKFIDTLPLFNMTIQGESGHETAFMARVDWVNNSTDFAFPMGYFGFFSQVQFTKSFSAVSFAFANKGDATVFGRLWTGGIRMVKLSIPQQAGITPQPLYFSPIVIPDSAINIDPQFVAAIDTNVANSPAIFLYRYYDNQATYNLALFPIENGLISNYKIFPIQMSESGLSIYSIFVGGNNKNVTIVFRSTNATLISGIPSNYDAQLSFVTLQLPTVPLPVPTPEVVKKYENLESEFTNLVSNGTNFVVEGSIALTTDSGVVLTLDNKTEIITQDNFLSIELLESNLNLESYSAETPLLFDVFVASNSTSPSGQLVGNGYQISSNARINKLEICINAATALQVKQSYYQKPAIAVKVAGVNRFQVEPNLTVERRGNQFCTRAATSSPVVYPALIGTAPQSSVQPPPVTGSSWTINTISFAAIVFFMLIC